MREPFTSDSFASGPQVAKDSDSGRAAAMVSWSRPNNGPTPEKIMNDNTCAACDCELDEQAIAISLGGHTVEVCCEECAQKLREADVRP